VNGSRLIEVTAPGTEAVAPWGVTLAFCPTCTAGIEARGTLTVTSTAPAPTTVMDLPSLEVPVARLIEPTVPAMDDFSVAEARAAVALVRAVWALVTAAWSETTRAALDSLAEPDWLPEDWPPKDWLVGWLVAGWVVADWVVDAFAVAVAAVIALLTALLTSV